MPYGGDPENDPLDTVRLLVGDTDNDSPLLVDEEVQFFLTFRNDNVYYAAADAAESLAAKFARSVNLSVEGLSASFESRYQHYKDLAASLRKQAGSKSRVAGPRASNEFKTRKPLFDVGMHDYNRSTDAVTRGD